MDHIKTIGPCRPFFALPPRRKNEPALQRRKAAAPPEAAEPADAPALRLLRSLVPSFPAESNLEEAISSGAYRTALLSLPHYH